MIFVKIRILFGTMKHVLLPLVAASALLITACQSRPIPVSEAKPAPQARIFKYQSPAASTLVVMRDKSMVGAGWDA